MVNNEVGLFDKKLYGLFPCSSNGLDFNGQLLEGKCMSIKYILAIFILGEKLEGENVPVDHDFEGILRLVVVDDFQRFHFVVVIMYLR